MFGHDWPAGRFFAKTNRTDVPPARRRRVRDHRQALLLLSIAGGGAFGALSRYMVSLALPTSPAGFPWGTFLVNLGNIMKRWSNDRFLSTPHGVLNDSGELDDAWHEQMLHSPTAPEENRVESTPSPLF